MTDFYSQNRCVCSTRSHGPLLCAFCISFHFNSSQYGFRSGHSTDYAALELIDRLITKMDRNEVPINIYLDLSKAFDTIDHFILIDKLKYYGISESVSAIKKLPHRQKAMY